MEWFSAINPVLAALIGGTFTWFATAFGAMFVFFFKHLNRKLLDASLGFAAGVMIAASFWSLLDPALELSEELGYIPWLWPLVGFLSGGIFLRILDLSLPHMHRYMRKGEETEGPQSSLSKNMLMIIAVTIHNIPEGLAVGVAFGATAIFPQVTIAGAIALTVGIGIQNIPEGFAVSMPLLEEKMTKRRAFFWGQASGSVEAIAAVVGALLVIQMQAILPFALGFAAGAMIFVVIEEVIPQSQSAGNNDLATGGGMLGFAIMMFLDVSLS
ncbi:ZIP family metal transporter [Entomospira culicis]|uniref:ZIP family metal transporter n=1 Tax=Entomospira culicis TaxID=2719989 RepID=A0A968GEH4_9SPIO|nr:ZIP family metal transporter [Entomospira culicis]NIZ18818.1 ZIP family metal transporter [Entomospira culicis]NIZ69033.1 ZIP family metal transporter [Entomospira culicis]WDI37958.1 ZIP family metal transporter [Entomospira culicis]WDI39583.1 ZIP family metal transporter [Entomospira culicis]